MSDSSLVKLELKDGRTVEFHRDPDNTVRICCKEFCISLPHGTGQTTMQLFALLEPLGKIIEEDDSE